MTRTLFFRLTGVTIVMAIAALSLLPGNKLPDVLGSDKLHHTLAYFVCMFCWGQAYVRPTQRLKLAIAFIAMGVLIECLQYFTPTRYFEVSDMFANTLGVILAWLVVTVQLSVKRRYFADSATAPSLPNKE